MDKLFDDFIKERRYLNNLSETTLRYYLQVFNNFRNSGFTEPTKACLTDVIMALRGRGVSVGAINTYLRGINSFLRWMAENGHCAPFTLKPLKGETRMFRSLTEKELKSIITFKPRTTTQRRLHALLLLLMDTGLRINEGLTLKRSKIDFDNLLISVIGKGNKERIVPFSYELRKVLYKHLSTHKFELAFCNRHGGKLIYDNVRRDFNKLMDTLGIDCDSAFHAFRRTFATNYIKNGGNPLVLQRLLGHSTLMMTNTYVKLVTEDLQKEQHRTSILNRLR